MNANMESLKLQERSGKYITVDFKPIILHL